MSKKKKGGGEGKGREKKEMNMLRGQYSIARHHELFKVLAEPPSTSDLVTTLINLQHAERHFFSFREAALSGNWSA